MTNALALHSITKQKLYMKCTKHTYYHHHHYHLFSLCVVFCGVWTALFEMNRWIKKEWMNSEAAAPSHIVTRIVVGNSRCLENASYQSQSINLFSQLCNNKNECQQNNVKHSDGTRKASLISAGRPNKYIILHKIVKDRQKQRLRDRQTCSDKSCHKLQIKRFKPIW